MNTIKDHILIKINNRKCITARTVIEELHLHNSFWTKKDIREAIMSLSGAGFITEVEIMYSDNTNDSILLPRGTVISHE